MFGNYTSTTWAVTYVVSGITYYLSDLADEDVSKCTWTTRKEKARKYTTLPSAVNTAEAIKVSRKHNKAEITTVAIIT